MNCPYCNKLLIITDYNMFVCINKQHTFMKGSVSQLHFKINGILYEIIEKPYTTPYKNNLIIVSDLKIFANKNHSEILDIINKLKVFQ